MAIRSILVSPDFLFRLESQPAGVAPNTPYRLSDLDLASRLSFFLWSSIPDDELVKVAEKNNLHKPEVLQQQVRRMLADPRSSGAGEQFRRPVAPHPQRGWTSAESRSALPLRRQPAQGPRARDEDALRKHHQGESQRHRSARRRLHVSQRAAGEALRHSRRRSASDSDACRCRPTVRAAGCSDRARF